ncbi:MAG: undecaprenyldiphospho-muramoylpentapeptide beta-N-acetylglucosaminyltransferase, partial [Pseudomonadota bacterium]
MAKTLLVMAGGTGGHIFPGLAVADAAKEAGWRVVWLGNPAGMEARLVPSRGYEMVELRFDALRGKGLVRKLLLPFNLLRGFWQAWRVLGEVKPDVVIGMGGFVSFPAGMMAVLKGIPLVVHEQNSVAGLANRVLAGVAERILTGFPDVLKKGNWVGNPVRVDIATLPLPAERYGERQVQREPLHLLVVGGSLGAQALNEALPAALALLPESERPQVVHQSGEKHLDALKAAYGEAGVHANCVSFIDDMAGAYAWADLVVCRAGALTIAELAAAGVA